MMTYPQALLLIAIALIWLLYVLFYREYRIDLLRQRLFAIRDDLFQFVANSPEVDFDHVAHERYRTVLNGLIRFAHELTLFRVVLLGLAADHSEKEEVKNLILGSCEDLPLDVSKKFTSFHSRIAFAITDHVVHTSMFLCPVLVPIKLLVRAIHNLHGSTTKAWTSLIAPVYSNRVLYAVEHEASRIGSSSTTC